MVVFLTLYSLFFTATGLNQLGFSTLQAKLIPPARRGRLIAAGGVLGSAAAVTVAYGYLRDWQAAGPGSFALPFAATAAGMLASSAIVLLVRENRDEPAAGQGGGGRFPVRRRFIRRQFAEAAAVVRADPAFRRVAGVGCLFVTAQLVFPHYVPLFRARFGAGALPLVDLVVAQNVGAGLFSVALGRLADARGNRLTARVCLCGIAAIPPAALLLASADSPRPLVGLFFLLGLTPVTFKTVTNYTLELAAPANHPRYVSTLKLCMAVPFLLAVPVGALIDAAGHAPVFLTVAGLVSCGAALTFFSPEPRHAAR